MASGESRVGQTFGKYNITGRLGKGGMGEVYEAYDNSKGRTVALKILAPQFSRDAAFRTRFQRESRAAAILQEPHVIPIHDWGEFDGNLYIDMRLVKGDTLYDVIAKGPLDPVRAVTIVGGVAAALDAAHAAGLIHRDIKPQNIILTADDFPYLVDFGIAEAKGDPGLTMTGTYLGTVTYMAPERFEGIESTPAVDVYALACVLHECLTGGPPFPGGMEKAMIAHATSPPPRASMQNRSVPPSFDEVIVRGMAKSPKDRYRSAGDLARAAKQALTQRTPQAPQRTVDPPTVSVATVRTPVAPPTPPPQRIPRQQPPPTPPPQPIPSHVPRPQQPPPTPPPQHVVRQQPAHQTAADPFGNPFGSDPFGADPFGGRPIGPPPQLGPPPRSGSPAWLIPTIIGAVVVLILALVGIGYGLTSDSGSQPVADSTTPAGGTTSHTTTTNTTTTTTSKSSAVAPPPAAPPPTVTGKDQSSAAETCDAGFQRQGKDGFGSRAGRGSVGTSCEFTMSVLNAYWAQFGQPTGTPRTVSAPGSVSCPSVLNNPSGCDGYNFLMLCQTYSGQGYVTCEGGRNAIVYLY